MALQGKNEFFYNRAYLQIKSQIQKKKFKPNQLLPSYRTLSKIHNISYATVQIAIAKLEKEGFVYRHHGKGVYVHNNPFSKEKKIIKPKNFSVITELGSDPIGNPYFSRLFKGCSNAVKKNNIDIILTLLNLPEYTTPKIIENSETDGLIICSDIHKKLIKDVRASKIPYVLVEILPKRNEYSILIDNKKGATTAALYLMELGHTKIGMINAQPLGTSFKERMIYFRQTLKRNNLDLYKKHYYEITPDWETGYELGDKINVADLPTAFFIASGLMAAAFMTAIQKRNVKIPQDLSIITFDDFPEFSLVNPSQTCISFPVEQLGEKAVTNLLGIINNNIVEHTTRIKTKLIIRESTRKV